MQAQTVVNSEEQQREQAASLTFSAKEVSDILNLAAQLQGDTVRPEQIYQMGEEAGLSREAVARAIAEYQRQKLQSAQQQKQHRRHLQTLLVAGSLFIGAWLLIVIFASIRPTSSATHYGYPTSMRYPSNPVPFLEPIMVSKGQLMAQSKHIRVYLDRVETYSEGVSEFRSQFGVRETPQKRQAKTYFRIQHDKLSNAQMVAIPSDNISHVSIAPDEKRILFYDEQNHATWVVNADGSGLSKLIEEGELITVNDGTQAKVARRHVAGWRDSQTLIIHTNKGRVAVRLSAGNTAEGYSWAR
jgi:hypothetical protein